MSVLEKDQEPKILQDEDKIHDVPYAKVSASYYLYSRRYDSSKLGFHPIPRFIPEKDTLGEFQYLGLRRSK